jgi:hypothetical protein
VLSPTTCVPAQAGPAAAPYPSPLRGWNRSGAALKSGRAKEAHFHAPAFRKALTPRRSCVIFTGSSGRPGPPISDRTYFKIRQTPRSTRFPQDPFRRVAPNPVSGLWTACTRLKRRVLTSAYFSIDGKNRRSTTGSFFDSFLSFSGWCGVRGSSEVTFLIERLGRRASKGL